MAKKTTKKKTAKKPAKKAPKKAVKKAAKKTSKKPASARNTRLNAKDLARFQDLLLQKRREIIGSVNEIHDEALKNSRMDAAGDLSSMPIHMADLGSDTYEQEFALGLMDSERKLLQEIDDALRRIEEKAYGICEGTGKPIKKARLEAQPWARYCVEFARMLEQGLVREPEE